MRRSIIIISIMMCLVSLQGYSQKEAIYKHPTLGFQFTASENWQRMNHPKDKLIYEMADPQGEIHVILWVTETESGPKHYLEKMADMKGLRVTGDPLNMAVNGRKGWVIKAEGEVNGIESTVFILSIPMTGEKYVHHKNHIAQYIMQIWCPTELLPQKVKEIETIHKSVEIQ